MILVLIFPVIAFRYLPLQQSKSIFFAISLELCMYKLSLGKELLKAGRLSELLILPRSQISFIYPEEVTDALRQILKYTCTTFVFERVGLLSCMAKCFGDQCWHLQLPT